MLYYISRLLHDHIKSYALLRHWREISVIHLSEQYLPMVSRSPEEGQGRMKMAFIGYDVFPFVSGCLINSKDYKHFTAVWWCTPFFLFLFFSFLLFFSIYQPNYQISLSSLEKDVVKDSVKSFTKYR